MPWASAIWIHKAGSTPQDYQTLLAAIDQATELAATLEGIYKWIAFPPAKMDARTYDRDKYVELLLRAIKTLVTPLGWTRADLEAGTGLRTSALAAIQLPLPQMEPAFPVASAGRSHPQTPAISDESDLAVLIRAIQRDTQRLHTF